MENLYKFLNNLFDPQLNGYLTKQASDLINSTMKDIVEKKIGAEEFASLEGYIVKNHKKTKFRKLSEKVNSMVSISQLGRIRLFDHEQIHPVLYDQARGGVLLLCGLNYYLKGYAYDLEKTYDNVCGSKIIVSDNGLEDYIKDID
ncbi:hypothetical protein FJZ53_07390 [Candidatus Woesearchaeota archaeon]|nr:hypothetical protein [Candidatus Woesearchaeota archaeon]